MAAGAVSAGGSPVAAQPSSAPPPFSTTAPVKVQPVRPAAQRPAIELAPAERQSIDAARSATDKPARIEDALVPTAEDMKPRAAEDRSTTTRIEQLRTSNRVSEVVVTPPGQTHSYVMTNREGRQPFATTQMSSGLSVPMFLRFEFGKPTPTNLPPPPAPTPSR